MVWRIEKLVAEEKVMNRSSIFGKNHIFDPMQLILNAPMTWNFSSTDLSRQETATQIISRCLIRLCAANSTSFDLDIVATINPSGLNRFGRIKNRDLSRNQSTVTSIFGKR